MQGDFRVQQNSMKVTDRRSCNKAANGLRFTCAAQRSEGASGASVCWAALFIKGDLGLSHAEGRLQQSTT